jgi:hypothetical protein
MRVSVIVKLKIILYVQYWVLLEFFSHFYLCLFYLLIVTLGCNNKDVVVIPKKIKIKMWLCAVSPFGEELVCKIKLLLSLGEEPFIEKIKK